MSVKSYMYIYVNVAKILHIKGKILMFFIIPFAFI